MNIRDAYTLTTLRKPPGFESTYDAAVRLTSERIQAERAARTEAERLKPHLPSLNQRLCAQGYAEYLTKLEVTHINARALMRGMITVGALKRDLREAITACEHMLILLDAEDAP